MSNNKHRVKIEKIFESFINGEKEYSVELTKQLIHEMSAEIVRELENHDDEVEDFERGDMGDDLASEISADKDEIDAEEMYIEDSDIELDLEDDIDDAAEELSIEMDSEEVSDIDDDLEDDLDVDDLVDDELDSFEDEEEIEDDSDVDVESEIEDKIDDLEDDVEDLSTKFDELEAKFKELQGEEIEELEECVDLVNVVVKKDKQVSKKNLESKKSETDKLELGGEPAVIKSSKDKIVVAKPSVEKKGSNTAKKANDLLKKK